MFRISGILKKELVFGPLFKLAEAIFELLVPLVMARIIDVGIAQKDLAYILRQGGVIVGFALVGIVCSLTCQYFAARCSQGMGTELRRAVYHQINLFSAQQVSQFSSSSLITRLTNDVNQVQQAVAMLIRLAIRAPFLVLGSLTMAMVIDRTMALIFLGGDRCDRSGFERVDDVFLAFFQGCAAAAGPDFADYAGEPRRSARHPRILAATVGNAAV